MSSSQHSFLSQPRSRPKPLLIICEMPTAPLSTFVHMASLKMDQLHSSSDPIADHLSTKQNVFTQILVFKAKVRFVGSCQWWLTWLNCKREVDCRVFISVFLALAYYYTSSRMSLKYPAEGAKR